MSIEFVHLSKTFGGTPVLRDVTLTVETGQIMFIVGASGAGKSVLMRHVIGLLRPDSGEVRLDGERVDVLPEARLYDVRRRCGFIFQNPTLLDFLTLAGNVALPLERRSGLPRAEAHRRACGWLERVDVAAYAGRLPEEVGVGIQKRASIARALALEPAYLIYDEPTTGLDPVSARRTDALIRYLADTTGVTSVVVSHDLESIFGIADRIAFLYQGGLRLVGTPDDFRQSDDPVVRQFIAGCAEGPMEV